MDPSTKRCLCSSFPSKGYWDASFLHPNISICLLLHTHIVFQWVLCIIEFPTLPNFCSSLLKISDKLLYPQTSWPPLSFSCGIWAKTNGRIYCVIACDLVVTPPHFIDAFTFFSFCCCWCCWCYLLCGRLLTKNADKLTFNAAPGLLHITCDWFQCSANLYIWMNWIQRRLAIDASFSYFGIGNGVDALRFEHFYITDECPIWN